MGSAALAIRRRWPRLALGLTLLITGCVRGPDPGPRSLPEDNELAFAVEGALEADPAVDAARVLVRSEHEIVILTGPVPYVAARRRAVALARAFCGVRAVVDRLAIEVPLGPGARAGVAAVENRIQVLRLLERQGLGG